MTSKPINWNDSPLKAIFILMQRMIFLLDEETRLLKDGKIMAIENFQKEKNSIAEQLEIAQKRVAMNPLILGKVAPEQKKQLELLGKDFTRAMSENYQELVKAKEVNRKIMFFIVETIRRHFKSSSVYNQKGGSGIATTSNPNTLPPITYDSVI